jgi:transcriptional regulator
LFVSHLPFLLSDDRRCLYAHVARANPQWREIAGQEVLIVFNGAHDYISPGWYQHDGVPTWNYQVVHVYADAEILEEEADLRDLVDQLSRVHEASQESPWTPHYPDSMLRGIVGLKFAISETQAKFKLSQNRARVDQEKVAERLEEKASPLASAMQEYQKGGR